MTTQPTFVLVALLGLGTLAPDCAAQIDPQETVKKILVEVSEEMSEIDRLLLESARKGASAKIAENIERLEKLFDQTQDSQGKVVRGIDRLIEEIEKMAQQSSSSQSQSSQQQQRDQQQRNGERPEDQQQSTRNESRTPDMVQQPQNRQGEQPQPQDQPNRDGEPRNPQDTQDPGQNTRTGTLSPDGTEEVGRPEDAALWGSLPKYLRFLQSRGGQPELPPKYRRLIEEYLKRGSDSKRKR